MKFGIRKVGKYYKYNKEYKNESQGVEKSKEL